MTRRVLDLFCGLGGFSAAFADAEDWSVTAVDIEERFDPDIQADVMGLRPSDFDREFDVVLASPPCTSFTTANSKTGWLNGEPQSQQARNHLTLVYHTLGLIHGLTPRYWFMENPRGRLRNHIGCPEATVTYCQYGEDSFKPTDLWGRHPPMTYRRCSQQSSCHVNHRGDRKNTYYLGKKPAERAKVPYDLSEAIREAVDTALDGEAPEQTTLAGVDA